MAARAKGAGRALGSADAGGITVLGRWLLWYLGWALCAAAAPAAAEESASFSVSRQSGEFLVEGWLAVPVPPGIAWEVLTDYDRMAEFIPDMRESRVLERDGERQRVLQRGVTRLGPLAFDYDVEREVWLSPQTIVRSRGIRGNMKKLEMETSLAPETAGVRIHYRALIVPGFWVPPLIGPRLMRSQAERQFAALIAEMKRRAAAPP